MTINFYLNIDPKSAKDEKPIYCYVREMGKTLCLNTGEMIETKHWDVTKQEVKKTYIGHPELNDYLSSFREAVKKIIRNAKIEDPLQPFENLKKILLKEIKHKSDYEFFSLFDTFIDIRKPIVSHGTTQKFQTMRMHLKKFAGKYNLSINLDAIDIGFFDQLHNYFLSIGISNNTIRKDMQFVKSFLRWCLEREYTKNDRFERYQGTKHIETDNIALTKEDLHKIINCNKYNSKLQHIKDLFLFQLYTGQRYGDILKFKMTDVKNDVWLLRQQKTKKVIDIPLIEPALIILKKYNGVLPLISNQKMNVYLKELGEAAGLDEIITVAKFLGAEKIEKELPKYQLLTTHTARRTFVSLASYEGINQQVVKSYTGHSTDRMLSQYFKRDNAESRKAIEGIFTN